MPRILPSEDICARALRMVGEFPTSESAPDGEQLREAMFWLDMIYATTAGIREVFHLQPASVVITLTPGVRQYDLQTAMGGGWPGDGISFPTGAELLFPGGTKLPVEIVQKKTMDEIGTPAGTGVPRLIYIDRSPTPSIVTWPTLAATEVQTYQLLLAFQRQSPDLSPKGVSGARPNSTNETGLRASWQQWMVLTLAISLGSGAINKQSDTTLQRWEKMAGTIRQELDAFENREHDTEPPIVDGYAISDYEAEARLIDGYDSYRVPMGRYRGYLG